MKKMFKTLMMAFVAIAAIGVTGCSEDDDTSSTSNPTPTNNTIDLKGTSWVGVYNDTYQNYPAVLTWSLDFTSDTEGELLFELTVAGQQQGNYDVPFTWTFDGTNGTMNAGQMGASQFTYDAATNTIKMMMMVEVEGDGAQLGGMTTFYPRGSQPTPPDNPDQPAHLQRQHERAARRSHRPLPCQYPMGGHRGNRLPCRRDGRPADDAHLQPRLPQQPHWIHPNRCHRDGPVVRPAVCVVQLGV